METNIDRFNKIITDIIYIIIPAILIILFLVGIVLSMQKDKIEQLEKTMTYQLKGLQELEKANRELFSIVNSVIDVRYELHKEDDQTNVDQIGVQNEDNSQERHD